MVTRAFAARIGADTVDATEGEFFTGVEVAAGEGLESGAGVEVKAALELLDAGEVGVEFVESAVGLGGGLIAVVVAGVAFTVKVAVGEADAVLGEAALA